MFKVMKKAEFVIVPGSCWLEVYQPICGWKSIQYVAMSEKEAEESGLPVGFVEPNNTGMFPYATEEEAVVDAVRWAAAEELPVIVRDELFAMAFELGMKEITE